MPKLGPATTPRLVLWSVLAAVALPVEAAAAPDDWSLSRERDDPALVSQRMTKLRRNPFDGAQWRALRKSIGLKSLGAKIDAALEHAPDDAPLRILAARVDSESGDPSAGAKRLADLEGHAGRWEGKTFDLRIDMHVAASESAAAVAALVERAEGGGRADRGKLLLRAYEIADSGDLGEAALSIARKLGSRDADQNDRLRLARAASRAGEAAEADRVYGEAISHAKGRERDDLVAERAQARLDGDNAGGATSLLWSLLQPPDNGTKSQREAWWDSLAEAHRRDASTDVLVSRLTAWLADAGHGTEAAGWRTLAQARETAGMDPTEAWRKVIDLDPRDVASHTSLIDALDAKGDEAAAMKQYDELADRHPREVELGLELASRRMAEGQRPEALRLVADIERRVDRRSRELMLVLDFYNLHDEPDLALGVARRLVDLAPRKVESRMALGEQLYQMGHVTEALDQWAKIPDLMRPKHAGWAKQAEILAEHGRTAEAVSALNKSLKLEPEAPQYLRLRAVLAEDQRRPGTALGLWEQVRRLATAPKDKLLRDEARTRVVELLVGGAINRRRIQLEAFERDSRDVLDRGAPKEDALEAGRFLAELYTRQESYSKAVDVQQRLLELAPEDPSRLTQLAAAQRRAGQVQSAMGTLEELLSSEPQRKADVLAEMSELAFEAGDADGALASAERAARRDHTQLEALIRLGQMHERHGDITEARRAYETALQVDPDDARAQVRLAELELTEGRDEKAADTLRDVLDGSGPPELVREAGRRALDLAEASGSTMELFEVAVDRTTKRPEASEPRGLLLDALDRVDRAQVHEWIAADGRGDERKAREAALRQPLVAALARGSVGARMRAAEHLGWLQLPETATPLAKMGASLVAPRDSTATVRDAFERARVAAIRGAGNLQDESSVSTLQSIVSDASMSSAARHAAGWALAQIGTAEAAEALAGQLRWQHDSMLATVACAALAHQPRAKVSAEHRQLVQEAARQAGNDQVQRTCTFALAALASDADARRFTQQVHSSDPITAAIAAWRLGRIESPSDEVRRALMVRFVGPAGLARDAAGASLANSIRNSNKHRQAAEIADFPTAPRGSGWAKVIDRWLVAQLTPTYTPLTAEDLAPYTQQIAAALDAAQTGTRAEREAASAVVDECTPKVRDNRDAAYACLSPLADAPLRLKVRD